MAETKAANSAKKSEQGKKAPEKKNFLLRRVSSAIGFVIMFGALAVAIGIGLIVCL